MFKSIEEYSLLKDFYGELLTSKQREVFKLYYDENLSLGEISEELGISRQAVHNMLKNSERSLAKYERKLGLIKRFNRTIKTIKGVDNEIDKLIQKYESDKVITDELNSIKEIINKIED